MNPTQRPGLIVQEVSGERLVYDERTDQAAALNLPATRVFELCDGSRSIDEIIDELGRETPEMPEDAVRLALADLAAADLIEAPPITVKTSRRQLLVKLGVAAAVVVPAVELITAPTAAAASSPGDVAPGGGNAPTTTTTTEVPPSTTTTTTTTTDVPAPVPSPVDVPAPVPSPVDVPAPVPSPVDVPAPVPSPVDVPAPIPSPTPVPTPVPSPLQVPTPVPSPTVGVPQPGPVIFD